MRENDYPLSLSPREALRLQQTQRLMMNHGMDGVAHRLSDIQELGSVNTAEAIVMATHHYNNDPSVVSEACSMIGEAMPGLEIETLK